MIIAIFLIAFSIRSTRIKLHRKVGKTSRDKRDGASVSLEISYLSYFRGEIQIGTPPQTFDVIFDTTTAIVAVASNKGSFPYSQQYDSNKSSTYKEGGERFTYGILGGLLNGTFCRDDITIGNITVKGQTFNQIEKFDPFLKIANHFDGFFGLGFSIPSYRYMKLPMYRMIAQKLIKKGIFAFHFARNISSDTPGELTIGYIDPNHYSGAISYVPIINDYKWAFNIDKISFDDVTWKNLSGTVSTGSNYMFVPKSHLSKIYKKFKSFEIGKNKYINCSNVENFHDLIFHFGGKDFTLTPQDYLYRINSSDTCMLLILEIDSRNLYFGWTFLRKYYSVFDFDNRRIGFAEGA